MKKKYFTLSLIAGITFFLGQSAYTNSGGAPGGHSGSPASNGNTCARAGCHNGGPAAAAQTVTISTDIPATGFIENTTYSITIDGDDGVGNTSVIAFQASVESSSGHAGAVSVSNANTTRKIGDFITHTFSGIGATGGQNSWSFDWNSGTAPDQTTVYAAVNFANGNSGTSGDVIVAETLVLTKDVSIGVGEITTQKLAAYPNPAKEQMTVATSVVEDQPLQIFNMQGKMVQEINTTAKVDNHHWTVSVVNLSPGSYLLRTGSGQTLTFQKK
jgi:hypothetical protein